MRFSSSRSRSSAQHGADAGIGQDGVEGFGEVGAAVADQELHRGSGVFKVHDQIACHLRGPLAGRMERAAEDADSTGGMLDYGQNVDLCAVQEVGGEEIAGHDAFGLGLQEVRPGDRTTSGRRVDAGGLEDFPEGGGGDSDAESGQLAVDPPVAPCRLIDFDRGIKGLSFVGVGRGARWCAWRGVRGLVGWWRSGRAGAGWRACGSRRRRVRRS